MGGREKLSWDLPELLNRLEMKTLTISQHHDKEKKESEGKILTAFISYYSRETGTTLKDCGELKNKQPDFICKDNQHCIGVELTEWLLENQVRISKGKDRLENDIRKAITKSDIYNCLGKKIIFLVLKSSAPSKNERHAFTSEFIDFLKVNINNISTSDDITGFSNYKLLVKYLHHISCRESPLLCVAISKGGAFDSKEHTPALLLALGNKINKYSLIREDLKLDKLILVVYVGANTLLHNSPYKDDGFYEIGDHIKCARDFIKQQRQNPFGEIWLFEAFEANGKIYRIWPE